MSNPSIPDVETPEAYFDRTAGAYDAKMLDRGWAGNRLLDIELEDFPINPQTVLDLGAGTGETVATVLQRTNPQRVDAVDISAAMTDRLRARFTDDPRVRVTQSSIRSILEASKGGYGAITGIGVWPFHTSEEQAALTALAIQRLAPGGRLYFTYAPLYTEHTRDFDLYGDQGTVRIYRRPAPTVTQDLLDNGIEGYTNEPFVAQPLHRASSIAYFVVAYKPAIEAGPPAAHPNH